MTLVIQAAGLNIARTAPSMQPPPGPGETVESLAGVVEDFPRVEAPGAGGDGQGSPEAGQPPAPSPEREGGAGLLIDKPV